MFYQLLIVAVILGLTFFQALQGLYSAAVMAVAAVLSAVLAFNYYEAMSAGFAAQLLGSYADAVCLVFIFVASLAVLRIAADKLLGGMVHFPLLADRIGGGAVGLVSSLILAGVLAVALQMIPFGGSILGYRALDRAGVSYNPVWMSPDRFTIGLIERLSAGSLAGEQRFADAHPDFLFSLAAAGDAAVPTGSQFVSGALSAVTVRSAPDESGKPRESKSPAPARWIDRRHEVPRELMDKAKGDDDGPLRFDLGYGGSVRLLKVRLHIDSRIKDEDNVVRLLGSQVQLVAGSRDGSPSRTILAGWLVLDADLGSQIEPFGAGRFWNCPVSGEPMPPVEAIFAVPDGLEPWFVSVRRDSRAEVKILAATDRVIAPRLSPYTVTTSSPLAKADWNVISTTALPVRLACDSLDAETVSYQGGGHVALQAQKLTSARIQGPVANFVAVDNSKAKDIVSFRSPPEGGRPILLFIQDGADAAAKNFWPDLPKATVSWVRSGANKRESKPIAGVFVKTAAPAGAADGCLFYYDMGRSEKWMDGANLGSLAGQADTFGLIVTVPVGVKKFTIEVGDRKIEVTQK